MTEMRTVMPNAPRFHAYWQRLEGKRIFIMKKRDWESLNVSEETAVNLRLEQAQYLPISQIFHANKFIAGTVTPTSKRFSIKIFRNDPKDIPTPINVDTYTVWIGLPTHFDIPKMIMSAATSDNGNFEIYATDHVFFVKEDPGNDHWLEQLPSEVQMLLSRQEEWEG